MKSKARQTIIAKLADKKSVLRHENQMQPIRMCNPFGASRKYKIPKFHWITLKPTEYYDYVDV